MKTEKYKELSRIRNGVETIPSILWRKYQIDHMPVRGLLPTKLRFGSPELQEAVWISEQCGSVRLNSPDQLTEQKQWCGLLPQNRANNGYLLFYKKFSRNIDFYGR